MRAGAAERRSPPDAERLLEPQPRRLEPAGRAGLPRPDHRRRPAVDIARAGSELKGVAARLTDQPVCIAARLRQRLAQPRDVHLQAVTRPCRGILAPQFVDQPLAGHRATLHQGEHRQQRARPLTAERDLPVIHPRLDRTEYLDP